MSGTVVWFRQDLRVVDHPALAAARDQKGPVFPIFIWAPHEEGDWPAGGATKWWLHHSLQELQVELAALGMPLVIRQGDSLKTLRAYARETGANTILWNRRYEPAVVQRDASIKQTLKSEGWQTRSFPGNLLFEPHEIETKSGTPYRVFTPFSKACWTRPVSPSVAAPRPQKRPAIDSESLPLEALKLLPQIPWDAGFRHRWTPGRAGALQLLESFLEAGILAYGDDRNLPDRPSTSSLGPALHFGELSSREVWHTIMDRFSKQRAEVEPYLRQLLWREFAHHLLFHFPETPTEPLRADFMDFPWEDSPEQLAAWQQGRTGYPLVDAGMRELWATGWMHNRVRMVVASLLVKDLLIPWQAGARWFWDTLVDADLANNTLGWQWVAGCGADAAPYFRIFNPVSQSEKFDPQGRYIRRWVPEIAALDTKWLHCPWDAPAGVLRDAGVILGKDYPYPIVDHVFARDRALEAFATLRGNSE